MRFRFFLLASLLAPIFVVHGATTTTLDPTAAVSTLNLLISQYESRIKQLENENAILRNEMVKAGIKIPLSEYSGAIVTEVSVNSTPSIVIPVTFTGTQSDTGSSVPTSSSEQDVFSSLSS